MITRKSGFKFWFPLERIEKAVDSEGNEVMRLGGIASTSDEDTDGEFLDPKGFDITPLMESGFANWHHQTKNSPAAVVGEPVFGEIRPEGLYLEVDLYPNSDVALQVWDLAQTLEKDSKTRRLGFSIEGKVLKRKSNDKKSIDFKKIEKALITGVAITHQPKNKKTFADIIKGEVDEDELDEQEEADEQEEKSMDTTSGRPVIPESVNKKIKNQTFSKSEAIEKIFKDIPNISIKKAESIYDLFKKIATMKNNKTVVITEEDIQKAYQALGLDSDIEKSEETQEVDSQETEEVQEPETDSQEDQEPETDSQEEPEEPVVEKGNRFDRIEKAIALSHTTQKEYIRSVGVLVKHLESKLEKAESENQNLSELIKGQETMISDLSTRIENFASGVPAPKSLRNSNPVERFKKADDGDIEKGGKTNKISMSAQKTLVASILDDATFSKGYDAEFSNACTHFEACGNLPQNIISRVKNEFGIELIK